MGINTSRVLHILKKLTFEDIKGIEVTLTYEPSWGEDEQPVKYIKHKCIILGIREYERRCNNVTDATVKDWDLMLFDINDKCFRECYFSGVDWIRFD